MTISAHQITTLLEDFLKSKRISGDTNLEIFVNPTLDEIKKVTDSQAKRLGGLREIRFIVDNQNRKVYVWDSGIALHDTVAKLLNINLYSNSPTPNFFTGIANCNHGKPVMLKANDYLSEWVRMAFFRSPYYAKDTSYPNKYSESLKSLLYSNLGWLESYITCGPVIKYYQDEYQQAVKSKK